MNKILLDENIEFVISDRLLSHPIFTRQIRKIAVDDLTFKEGLPLYIPSDFKEQKNDIFKIREEMNVMHIYEYDFYNTLLITKTPIEIDEEFEKLNIVNRVWTLEDDFDDFVKYMEHIASDFELSNELDEKINNLLANLKKHNEILKYQKDIEHYKKKVNDLNIEKEELEKQIVELKSIVNKKGHKAFKEVKDFFDGINNFFK